MYVLCMSAKFHSELYNSFYRKRYQLLLVNNVFTLFEIISYVYFNLTGFLPIPPLPVLAI